MSLDRQPCDTCQDLKTSPFKWKSLQILKRSGEQGCRICSVINAGVEKMRDAEGVGWQSRLHSGLRGQGRESHGGDFQWTEFSIQLTLDSYDRGTLQVKVKGNSTHQETLEFYTDSGRCPIYHSALSETHLISKEDDIQFLRILYRDHIDPILDLDKTMTFIQSRLAECEANHKCAPLEASSLPRRVLDVGANKDSKTFLHETHGESAPYITLSHCWGKRLMMKTTKTNYDQRRNGISWAQFPATFRDAIRLTRALKIRYLWIDALCIIQGDELDWEEQSALMATIYSNCYLNLAATHSPDSKGGLFFRRWIPSFDSKLHPKRHSVESKLLLVQESTTAEAAKVFVRRSLENAHIDMLIVDGGGRVYSVLETAPLVTRAWAYQERLLSPRTVNFHSAELTWDCGSGYYNFDCECGHLEDQVLEIGNFPILDAGNVTAEEILTTWLDVVTQFSRLRLTFARDRLPALAGIAKHIANITQSRYLAGIWETDIARGLLWRTDYAPGEPDDLENISDVGTRADPYRAPTWSWASVELITERPCSRWVSYNFAYEKRGGQWIDERFEVLDCRCEIMGSNPYGRVIGGNLHLKGAIMVMTFNYDVFYKLIHKDTSWYFDFDVFDKDNAYIADDETIIAMLVGVQEDDCSAILLIPARKEAGKYERVGIVGKRFKDFEGAEEMEVDII